ncbi:type A chloramphenicol O-acetyltransferase [Entomomonas asaccharolytica]|uniref:Chloramphenicol acetyltransferase n=1 Tax=Entomomonas asaccharolytica TaxID=2785331 RepID=A0A974NDT7_9GAMM|nr:type A chloramphenicol O-acetyltransferase [Entomomonas asaccharolytica]QQP84654.1 type A chloramphenicol O-acetyltransferase [Entomomonas asaccharolytica]
MNFNLIDIENWPRKEYYLHYMNQLRCSYSLTTNIDITRLKTFLKQTNRKIYPAQIYMLATLVNQYQEFRMNYNSDGALGYWDQLNPSYTIFNKSSETFSSIWTEYKQSFHEFYEHCIQDIAQYNQATSLMPKPNQPANSFTVSSLPWTSFTGFNINAFTDGSYLPPIFTLGKFIEQDNKTLMPIAIQVHHAVCDGFHVGRFINALQQLANDYHTWLNT